MNNDAIEPTPVAYTHEINSADVLVSLIHGHNCTGNRRYLQEFLDLCVDRLLPDVGFRVVHGPQGAPPLHGHGQGPPPEGTRRQLVVSDAEIFAALREVHLQHVCQRQEYGLDDGRFDVQRLSPGEAQRLAFARFLLWYRCNELQRRRLVFIVLDEATSALGIDDEDTVYGIIARMANVAYISVGHRPSLVRFHRRILRVHQGGKCELLDVDEPAAAAN